jgi:hypothetical protein
MKSVQPAENKITFQRFKKILMRSIIVMLFIFVSTLSVWAQRTVALLESKDGFFNIQGQTLGDSVLLTYYNSFSKKSENFCATLVTPEGKQILLLLPELHKRKIFAATHTADSLCVYYVDKNEDSFFTVITIHKRSGIKKVRPMNISVGGQLKAVFVDRNLFLVTVNKINRTLSFIEVENGVIINRQIFSVPDDSDNLFKLNAAVIQHETNVQPAEAFSAVKIYFREQHYLVTLEYAEKKQSTYVVLKLNKALGTVSRWTFQSGPGREDFASFIAGNKLICVTKAKNYKVVLYDIEKQHAIDSFLITKKNPIAKEAGIYRDDRTLYIANDYPVKRIIKKPGSVFVTGYSSDTTLVLKLGTHQISAPYFPMVSGLGLAVQAITAMISISVSLSATDNLDQYFYISWNGDSYIYLQKPRLAESIRDKFELSPSITFKGYLEGTHTSFGIYKFGTDKLGLMGFKR